MAKAEAKFIEKPVTMVAHIKDGVTLHLTHAEAQTLAEIVARIGGNESDSARKYASKIFDALNAAGYKYKYDRVELFNAFEECHFRDGSAALVEQP